MLTRDRGRRWGRTETSPQAAVALLGDLGGGGASGRRGGTTSLPGHSRERGHASAPTESRRRREKNDEGDETAHLSRSSSSCFSALNDHLLPPPALAALPPPLSSRSRPVSRKPSASPVSPLTPLGFPAPAGSSSKGAPLTDLPPRSPRTAAPTSDLYRPRTSLIVRPAASPRTLEDLNLASQPRAPPLAGSR